MKNFKKVICLQQPLHYQLYFGKMKKDLFIKHSLPMLLVHADKGISLTKENETPLLTDCQNTELFVHEPFCLIPASLKLQLMVKNKTIVMVVLNPVSHDFSRLRQWLINGAALYRDLACLIPVSHITLRRSLEQMLGQLAVPQQDSRVLQAAQILNERIGTNILIEDLAGEVCLSVPRFVQLFKQCTGLAVRRYRLLIRLNYVVKLVCGGTSPTSAAAEAGFADYAHFSRTFKEMLGLSPREMFIDMSALSYVYRFSQAGICRTATVN